MTASTTTDNGQPDPLAAAQDWITVWQSELAALAADREVQENWARIAQIWAQGAASLLPALTRAGFPIHDPTGCPGPTAPAGTTPAAAPSDGELDRLRARVAELEHRIATLERG